MNDVAASTKAQRRSAQCNSALPVMRRIMALACWLFLGGSLRRLALAAFALLLLGDAPAFAAPEMQKAHVGVGGLELACFYDTARALSPVRGGLLGRAGAGQMGGPEVGPALAGEPFGLRPPPSRNFGVIAASEHVGDSAAFE